MDMSISKHSMDIYRYIEISVYIHDIQMLELPDVCAAFFQEKYLNLSILIAQLNVTADRQ